MKRKILFRGISVSHPRKWVYGDLVYFTGQSFSETKIQTHNGDKLVINVVIPESVGQLIPNKSGLELYFGDIVRVTFSDGTHLDRVVVYDNENMRAALMNKNPNPIDTPMGFSFSWVLERATNLVNVGTIHDHLLNEKP